MIKRFFASLLAVCLACSMLFVPASAASANTAVQTAVLLGGMTAGQADSLSDPLTRGQLARMLVAFSPERGKRRRTGHGRESVQRCGRR